MRRLDVGDGSSAAKPAREEAAHESSAIGADGLVHDLVARNMATGIETAFEVQDDAVANATPFRQSADSPAPQDFKCLNGVVLERIRSFWHWFETQQARLMEIPLCFDGQISDEHMDRIVALGEACSAVDDDLAIEIESGTDRFSRRLVVSANGIAEAFPLVEALVDRAPRLPGWSFVKYRQRRRDIGPLGLHGRSFDPKRLRVGIYQHSLTGEFGLCVFMPGYRPEERETFQHIGFLFLDMTLGEFDVATKVRSIDFDSDTAQPHVPRVTLAELPGIFDRLFARSRH